MSTAATTDAPVEEHKLGDGLIGNLLGGDGIRGIAMTMVFVAHVFVNADPGSGMENYHWFKQVVGRFDLALAAFFVLSGYLIARPFLRSFVLDTKRPSARRFARNRLLRIVPAFYLIAAVVLLRFGLDGALSPTPDNPTGTAPASSWWQIVSVFTFTQSYTTGSATLPIGQAWSLDVEVAFYAAIPIAAAIAYRLGKRLKTPESRARAALIFVGGLALVSIYLRQHNDNTLASLASPPLIIYAFLPGVALAIAEPWAVPIFRDNPRRAKRFAWAAVGVAFAAYALYAYWDFNIETTAIHHALGRRSLMSALFGMALLAALIALQLGTGKVPRWTDNRWTNYMGERSYAFYLLHVAVILEVVNLFGSDAGTPTLIAAMLLVGFPVTLLLSALSWKYYEKPFLERRLPWAPGLRPTTEPAHEVAAAPPRAAATAGEDDRLMLGRARSAARAARLRAERARFELWARRLDAALRRAGGRLVLEAPHGAHYYELPHIEIHPYGKGGGTLTLRFGEHVRLGRDLILDVWAAHNNVFEMGDGATFRAGTRVQLHGGTVSIGAHTTIRDYCFLDASRDGAIRIGADVEIGQQVALHCVERLDLGDRVAVGERVSIFDSDHVHDGSDVKSPDQGIAVTPVVIGTNTFIGANSLVLRGVTMGPNGMLAAGSLIRAGDYPGGFLYAGKPLRAVRPLGKVPGAADRDVATT